MSGCPPLNESRAVLIEWFRVRQSVQLLFQREIILPRSSHDGRHSPNQRGHEDAYLRDRRLIRGVAANWAPGVGPDVGSSIGGALGLGTAITS